MYPKIRMAALFTLAVVTSLSLTGCCWFMPWLSQCPSGQNKPSELELEARQKIVSNRNYTETTVSTIKDKLKGEEEGAVYIKARSLYDKAMNENNTWLTLLALGIENNDNLEGSKSFTEQAKAAADAAESFLAYGRELTEKPGITTSSVQTKSFLSLSDFLTALVNNGITIWKENKAQKAKERKDKAESIKKELTWRKWKQIE